MSEEKWDMKNDNFKTDPSYKNFNNYDLGE